MRFGTDLTLDGIATGSGVGSTVDVLALVLVSRIGGEPSSLSSKAPSGLEPGSRILFDGGGVSVLANSGTSVKSTSVLSVVGSETVLAASSATGVGTGAEEGAGVRAWLRNRPPTSISDFSSALRGGEAPRIPASSLLPTAALVALAIPTSFLRGADVSTGFLVRERLAVDLLGLDFAKDRGVLFRPNGLDAGGLASSSGEPGANSSGESRRVDFEAVLLLPFWTLFDASLSVSTPDERRGLLLAFDCSSLLVLSPSRLFWDGSSE